MSSRCRVALAAPMRHCRAQIWLDCTTDWYELARPPSCSRFHSTPSRRHATSNRFAACWTRSVPIATQPCWRASTTGPANWTTTLASSSPCVPLRAPSSWPPKDQLPRVMNLPAGACSPPCPDWTPLMPLNFRRLLHRWSVSRRSRLAPSWPRRMWMGMASADTKRCISKAHPVPCHRCRWPPGCWREVFPPNN